MTSLGYSTFVAPTSLITRPSFLTRWFILARELLPRPLFLQHDSVEPGADLQAVLGSQRRGTGEARQAAARPRWDSVGKVLSRSEKLGAELEALEIEPGVLEKIRRWILGIAIVDGVFPPLVLFPQEGANVAFSAFPGSLQFDQGSQIHSFRIRGEKITVSSEKRPASSDEFIYGFSHFTQKRDPTSRRGYEQRSVVILTSHPYPAFFSAISSIFGPMSQEHGAQCSKQLVTISRHGMIYFLDHDLTDAHSSKKRPDPTPGTMLEIGFLGTVLQVEIPHSGDDAQQLSRTMLKEQFNPKLHILASAPPFNPPPILLFEASLSHLWLIWECVVLCKPILLFGSSPAQTSQAAWWFRDILRPIPLAGDIRPYFTIHDKDHSLLVNKLPPKPGLILGVTNPYFDRSCAHWPHILSLGRYIPPNTATRTTTATATPGPIPGWMTRLRKRYISKDRVLLKQLEDACRGSEQQKIDASLSLRLHFCSRTNELLIPLTRYLHTLIPTPTEVARNNNNNNNGVGSFFATIPLAKLLAFTTDELPMRVGQTLAGLMNAALAGSHDLLNPKLANSLIPETAAIP
ncbi:hypothetical protein BT96DRAFT_984670 [Gymnopus androsaceus JB14]|uniref:UDENN domain-containing protein n=1 Tax=Gymnopus androsaceus JB14 TaxID=1447944 RepID=A0A6A4IIW9_9AGAR|nr:hypothetical protein BT96DRAFT_984670 [Gymnopus androsaceus JB14]